ncbi:ABC transporter permease [Gulosibacter sp. 10]|uniref:ABC transporter permease n=1 Tax=Gulosibacter sp. 10 TaxID=1255570 RepID=UPI00097E8B78|nr:ABC transporter permease [Gulosibacter sp. 10]SJM69998.1 putative transporter, trans-membrane domain bacteriocin immunity protein [Gulosibacter sp. 10]
MRTIRAEALKLKRSMSWAVVLILPAALAITGSATTLADGNPLEDGWHTLWLRSVVFYGLFPLAIGVGILASLVWRSEHRGSNWNALMSGPTRSLSIVTGKVASVAILAISMQAVMLVCVIAMGKLVFGLDGMLPGEYFGISLLIALASIPIAALQSGLSMLMRSFAAPIAVAFLGAGFSSALLTIGVDGIIFVSPYGLISRVTQLGTAAFADTGVIETSVVVSILIAAVVLSAAIVGISTSILERSDART